MRRAAAGILAGTVIFLMAAMTHAGELTVDDFRFDGPLGSEGASLERVEKNHFRLTLGHAPNHPEWCNKPQFEITSNARGNSLRMDVVFGGGNSMILNEYFMSWSYDGRAWTPVQWQTHSKDSVAGDTLVFPTFEQDRVIVGHQVPLSYEDLVALVEEWGKDPRVKVRVIGQSLGGRNLYRVEITDPKSQVPRAKRWVHYFANQHPGEHNSQWRMVGMVRWLLGPEADEFRERGIYHFVLMMSPDAPSKGWYRVNAQGVDMNRSYRAEGSDPTQAHEAYLCQKDLEHLVASETPVTTVWSMHTWGGIVEPILQPGPEFVGMLGPWDGLRDAIVRNDPSGLIKPLKTSKGDSGIFWTTGPHMQFGVSAVLCEGAGAIYTQQENLASGVALIRGIAEFYRGTRVP